MVKREDGIKTASLILKKILEGQIIQSVIRIDEATHDSAASFDHITLILFILKKNRHRPVEGPAFGKFVGI